MSSEIVRLRKEMEQNYVAAQRGLYGYAVVARHEIITNAFAAVQPPLEQLSRLIGEEQAMQVLIQITEQHSPEQEQLPA